MAKIDIEKIELLDRYMYEPDTGNLYSLYTNFHKRVNPKVCATKSSQGYIIVLYKGKPYKAHNIIWKKQTGEFPKQGEFIDHINNSRDDNRWDNLRLCNKNTNQHNRSIDSRNTTGVKGLTYYNNRKMGHGYLARVCAYGKRKSMWFPAKDDPDEAIKLATDWIKVCRESMHMEYANHG